MRGLCVLLTGTVRVLYGDCAVNVRVMCKPQGAEKYASVLTCCHAARAIGLGVKASKGPWKENKVKVK